MLNGEVEAAQRAADQAVTDFFTKVRNTHPQIKTLQERYGRGVTFVFDSDGHEVWVIAIFSSDAPPILKDDDDFPGEPYPLESDEHEPSDADGEDDDRLC